MNRVDEVLNRDWSKETSSIDIPWTCPTCPGSQPSERDENDLQILSSLHCRCKGRDCFVVGLRAVQRETHWQVLTYTDLHYLQRFQDISSVASDFTGWIAWRQARTNAKSLRPTSDKTPCRVVSHVLRSNSPRNQRDWIQDVPGLSELSPLQADASLHVQSLPSLPVFSCFLGMLMKSKRGWEQVKQYEWVDVHQATSMIKYDCLTSESAICSQLSQIDESQVDAKLRIWKNINTLRKSISYCWFII